MTEKNTSSIIPSLDGFRAISILIVAASHCGLGNLIPGGLGVTIFFFLSGYLISTLLIGEYRKNGFISVKDFYIRRALRLAPPLLLTLAIAYALAFAGKIPGNFSWFALFSQLFYFANYYYIFFDTGNTVPGGTGVFWSLAVEEHFYILYPLLFSGVLILITRKSRLAWTFAVLCLIALLWRYHLATQPHFDEVRTYYASDTRFDSLLFGCALAFLKNPMADGGPRSEGMTPTQWGIFGAGVAVLASTLLFRNPVFRESLRYTLQGLALMPIFFYAIRYSGHRLFAILNTPIARRLGVYSYAIYLAHFVTVTLLEEQVSKSIPPGILLPTVLAISIAYAYLIDRYVDTYFKTLRKKFHGAPARPVVAATQGS